MYNILRTKKHKTRSSLSTASEHNLRLSTRGNIDDSQSKFNRVLFDSLDLDLTRPASFQEKLTEHYLAQGVKEKKDSVLAMEFVVSASPEFFDQPTTDRNHWAEKQIEFFKTQFGDNLKLAILHLDEKTPHLHIMVSTDETKQRRYKNKYGEGVKTSTSLNARRFNPQFLRDLHTAHALHNAPFNLNRGQKGSKAQHKTIKAHQAEMSEALEKIKKEQKKADMFDNMKQLVFTMMEQFYALFEIVDGSIINEEDRKRVEDIKVGMDNITGKKAKAPKSKAPPGG